MRTVRTAPSNTRTGAVRSLTAIRLRVEGDGEAVAVQALKAADPEREIVVVARPGWHRLPDLPAPVFVTPAGEVLGAPAGCALELSVDARLAGAAQAGTLHGWRAGVAAALERLTKPGTGVPTVRWPGMAAPLVPDALWVVIAPLIPPEPPKPKGGRPRVDDRAGLTGILFVLKSGIPWEMLPAEMGW